MLSGLLSLLVSDCSSRGVLSIGVLVLVRYCCCLFHIIVRCVFSLKSFVGRLRIVVACFFFYI